MDEKTQTTPEDAIRAALPAVNPKALMEAIEDPTVFPEIARGDFYVWMCRMRERLNNPNTPVAAMLEYGKILAKIGKLDAPEVVAPGAGATIVFNMPAIAGRPPESVVVSQPVVIEAEAVVRKTDDE